MTQKKDIRRVCMCVFVCQQQRGRLRVNRHTGTIHKAYMYALYVAFQSIFNHFNLTIRFVFIIRFQIKCITKMAIHLSIL